MKKRKAWYWSLDQDKPKLRTFTAPNYDPYDMWTTRVTTRIPNYQGLEPAPGGGWRGHVKPGDTSTKALVLLDYVHTKDLFDTKEECVVGHLKSLMEPKGGER